MTPASQALLITKLKVDLLNLLPEDSQLKADVIQFLLYKHRIKPRMSWTDFFKQKFLLVHAEAIEAFEEEQCLDLAVCVARIMSFYLLGETTLQVTNEVEIDGITQTITETRTCPQVLASATGETSITQEDCTQEARDFLQRQLAELSAKDIRPAIDPTVLIWHRYSIEKMLADPTATARLINTQDHMHETALSIAILHLRDLDLSRRLIQVGADIDATCEGARIIERAIILSSKDMTSYFLARQLGADIFFKNSEGLDLISFAFCFMSSSTPEKTVTIIADLISAGVSMATQLDWMGMPLFYRAAQCGQVSIGWQLLRAGCNPFLQYNGLTPFEQAALRGNLPFCSLLLEVDSNIDRHFSSEVSIDNIQTRKFLLQAGSSFRDQIDVEGEFRSYLVAISYYAKVDIQKALAALSAYPFAIRHSSFRQSIGFSSEPRRSFLQCMLSNIDNPNLTNKQGYQDCLYRDYRELFYKDIESKLLEKMQDNEANVQDLLAIITEAKFPARLADYVIASFGKYCYTKKKYAYAVELFQAVPPGTSHYLEANELGFSAMQQALSFDKTLDAASVTDYHDLQFTFACNACQAGSKKIAQSTVNYLFYSLCGAVEMAQQDLVDIKGDPATLLVLAGRLRSPQSSLSSNESGLVGAERLSFPQVLAFEETLPITQEDCTDTPETLIWDRDSIEQMLADPIAIKRLINREDSRGKTALIIAIFTLRDGDLGARLVENGADINAPCDDSGEGIIERAIRLVSKEGMTSYFLARQLWADISSKTSRGSDLISFAFSSIGFSNPEHTATIMDDLMDSGVSMMTHPIVFFLNDAAHLGQVITGRKLLFREDCDPCFQHEGLTPFERAARNNNLSFCSLLLERESNIDRNFFSKVPINSIQTRKFLLQAGSSLLEQMDVEGEFESYLRDISYAKVDIQKALAALSAYPFAIRHPSIRTSILLCVPEQRTRLLKRMLSNIDNPKLTNKQGYQDCLYREYRELFYDEIKPKLLEKMQDTEAKAQDLLAIIAEAKFPALLADYVFATFGKYCYSKKKYAYAVELFQAVQPGTSHYLKVNELGFRAMQQALSFGKPLDAARLADYHDLQFTFACNACQAGSKEIPQSTVNHLFYSLCGAGKTGLLDLGDIKGDPATLVVLARRLRESQPSLSSNVSDLAGAGMFASSAGSIASGSKSSLQLGA